MRKLVLLLAVLGVLAAPAAATGEHIDRVGLAMKEAKLISQKDLPYVWGGGHTRHPGSVRQVRGYDCSGSVSRVLYRAGLLRVTRTASGFLSWGRRGVGRITVYAKSSHVLLAIRGPSGKLRFFGTSSKNRGGGAGFFRPSRGYLSGFERRTLPALSG